MTEPSTVHAVTGRCPACSEARLMVVYNVGEPGRIRCGNPTCTDPDLVADYLDAPGRTSHVVTFTPGEPWDRRTEHTLRCRLDGLANCSIDAVLAHFPRIGSPSGPVGPGRFEVDLSGGSLWFRPACCECGCTWDRACPGGCSWAADHPTRGPLCTTCARKLDLPRGPSPRNAGPTSIDIKVG